MGKRNTPEDQSDENPKKKGDSDEGNDSEDSFGLPDIEYQPLDEPKSEADVDASSTKEEEQTESTPSYSSYSSSQERPVYTPPVEEKSKTPMIIGIVIGVVVIIAGFLIYNYVYVPGKEKERQEMLAKQNRDREQARIAREREEARLKEEARQKAIADSIVAANAKPAVGKIETLSERTRRYYVVITSAIDDDLLMDYAKKLSAKGVGTKIIPPFGKTKFSRLAIADHETFAAAQTNADAIKGEYGNEVWVVRY